MAQGQWDWGRDVKVLYWVVNFEEDAFGVVGYEDTIILGFTSSNAS